MRDFRNEAECDPSLIPDFATLCAFGGRLADSGREVAAMEWTLCRLRDVGGDVSHHQVPYAGWRCLTALIRDFPGQARRSTHAETVSRVTSFMGAGQPITTTRTQPPEKTLNKSLEFGFSNEEPF